LGPRHTVASDDRDVFHLGGMSTSHALTLYVILLPDGESLCGFSTQVMFDHTVDGKSVKIVFSGDTIIDKNHWGSMALPLVLGG
jgi:hypothetical protein